MHSLEQNNRQYTVYDSPEEIKDIVKFDPPIFCNKCGQKLEYASFYDSMNRFTLKAFCRPCSDNWALPLSKESYEKKMLEHWTQRVKDRDDNRCRMADENCQGDLHAHHIIPKKAAPSKKYDVDNGICLCAYHHKKIHSFM